MSDDNKIKNLLQKDSYCPESQFDEWSLIKNKMYKKSSVKFKFGVALCSLVLYFVVSKQFFVNETQVTNEEVISYLFDDSYFDDDALYVWVE